MRLLFLITFILVAFTISGQSPQIDSLERLLKKEDDSKRRVELLNALSFEFFNYNVEKANATTQQALALARKNGDKSGESWALAYRGLYFFLNGMLPDARSYFEQSFSEGKKNKDTNLQTYSLTQLGNVYRDKGEFDSARLFYRRAESASIKGKDDYYRSVVKINLGRFYLVMNKPDSALVSIKEALVIREAAKDSILMADAWMLLGNAYRAADDFKEAERYYQKTFTLTKRDQIILADYLENMGEIYFRKGDFQLALSNWSKVLSYYRKYQYKYGLANLLLRMGTIFQELGYYDLASEYLNNGLKISEKANYQYLVGGIYHELAWTYFRTREFDRALENNRKSAKIFSKLGAGLELAGTWDIRGLIERNLRNYDSSLYYHKKSLEGRLKVGNKVDISASLFNIGEFYLETQKFEDALPYFSKSLKIDKTLGDNYGISLNYNRIGQIYTKLLVFDSAKIYLDNSALLAIPISSNEIFRDNFRSLAEYYEALGKPEEAIQYYKKYNMAVDSIFSKNTAQSLASYRTLYDVERTEQELELLNKDNQLSKATVQRQRVILFSVIAGSFMFLALAAFYYRFSRKQKRLNLALAEKNEEVQAQSEELMEGNEILAKLNLEIAKQKEEIETQAEELKASNQSIVTINEKLEDRIETRTAELKQAFKELDTFFYRSSHDFRRPLTTFMGLAEVARILVKDTAALELFEKVNENAKNLEKMLRKLQSISDIGAHELIYKEVFLKEILEIELDHWKDEIERKKIDTTISVSLQRTFYCYPALIKIIFENLIENAIAFCTTVSPVINLRAYEEASEVVLEVQDNGLGIEPEYIERVFDMYLRASEHSRGNGLGLYVVKKTVQKINGRIELKSVLNEGTTVRVFLPYRLD